MLACLFFCLIIRLFASFLFFCVCLSDSFLPCEYVCLPVSYLSLSTFTWLFLVCRLFLSLWVVSVYIFLLLHQLFFFYWLFLCLSAYLLTCLSITLFHCLAAYLLFVSLPACFLFFCSSSIYFCFCSNRNILFMISCLSQKNVPQKIIMLLF